MTCSGPRSIKASPRVNLAWMLGVLLAWAYAPIRASAFSDAERFGEEAGRGGGGGRYFTGSPVDGYACSVCHQGGVAPKVRVFGLPIDGYLPGQTYDVEVKWENPALPHALHLEIIGRDGRAAGNVALLEEASIDALGRCNSAPTDKPAAYERLPPGRKVLGVQACGASHLRFRFTPPDAPDVAFALSVVSSNKKGTADGDGVFSIQRVLRRVGAPKRTADCSVARSLGLGSAPSTTLVGFVLALLWLRRSRRTRF